MENKLSKEFLDTHNEIEHFITTEYSQVTGVKNYISYVDAIDYLAGSEELGWRKVIYQKYGYELKQYAKLRNAIFHNRHRKYADPIAEPHEWVVKNFKDIKQSIINPQKLLDKAVLGEQIYVADIQDKIIDILNEMIEKTYTHVPIYENSKRLVGVFSENVLLEYFKKKMGTIINREATMKEFENFLPIREHPSENFEFVSKETRLGEAEYMFRECFKNSKRLSVIYITEQGKEDEPILGMVTPFDVLGK